MLKSGVPDAIRAFDEVLKPLGIRKCGIRLDSGDMAYLTQEARRKLDPRLDRVPNLRLQLPGRVYYSGPAAAGRQDRCVRCG